MTLVVLLVVLVAVSCGAADVAECSSGHRYGAIACWLEAYPRACTQSLRCLPLSAFGAVPKGV